jgi:hypothetical protein
MDSRRVLMIVALVALVASASAATCKQYTGTQAGARCNPPETCCAQDKSNGKQMWCDVGRCSLREVGEDVKIKACVAKESQTGNRCDINNGLCCSDDKFCNVGRCSPKTGK